MMEIPEEVRQYFSALGRANGAKGGRLGGKARAKKLSKARRIEIARAGGLASAAKRKSHGAVTPPDPIGHAG